MTNVALAVAILGFLAALCTLVKAVIELWREILRQRAQKEGRPQAEPRKKHPARRWFITSGISFVIGISFAGYPVLFPTPEVAISSPVTSVTVTAEGASVWFPVEGTSAHVADDARLKICVLVSSGVEWHVQAPASLSPNGNWRLAKAWIGDPSAPIRVGGSIPIVAVATSSECQQDDKVPTPGALNPEAVSEEVAPRVRSVVASPSLPE